MVFVGRIHSATVSGINLETNSVTVEWYEKNEIKGKEVCESICHTQFDIVFWWLYFTMLSAEGHACLSVCLQCSGVVLSVYG